MADLPLRLSQPLYRNQTLSCVLLHLDMPIQVAVVKQPIDLEAGRLAKHLAASQVIIDPASSAYLLNIGITKS